jgi:hypothetical protein
LGANRRCCAGGDLPRSPWLAGPFLSELSDSRRIPDGATAEIGEGRGNIAVPGSSNRRWG